MDVIKFQEVLKEKKVTKDELATIIGKDRATVYRKLAKNGDTFTIKEANLISQALNLTDEEANSIFLPFE